MTERRYRGKQSRPIPIWNGLFEHRDRIGPALWEFLWCIDGITEERNDIGLVHGGAPVKAERIAGDLNRDKETVRRHLCKLADEKYIRTRRTPYGLVIEVLHSKKFGIWRTWSKQKPQIAVSLERETTDLRQRNGKSVAQNHKIAVSKEDTPAVTQQKEQRPAAALNSNPEDSVWSFLEIPPCGPGSFRTLLEASWPRRNGGPYSVLVGDTLDAWEAAEGEKPKGCATLFRALARLREREKKTPKPGTVTSEPIHVFKPEEIPA